MGDGPATRARSAQEALAFLDDFSPGATGRVRARIPNEALEVVDGTARTGWIPFEHDRWIPHATLEELGEDEAVRYWRGMLGRHVRSPLLRTIVDGATRLFGMSPASIVRVVPRGWGLVFRDHCRSEVVARTAQSARVVQSQFATEVIGWSPYVVSFRAFFLGILDVFDADGEVELEVDRAGRRITYDLRWD